MRQISTKVLVALWAVISLPGLLKAQSTLKTPLWWYGVSTAANFSFNDGSMQQLTNNFATPKPFVKGSNTGRYASLLLEYRPARIFGGTVHIAYYENKDAPFHTIDLPCGCTGQLSTTTSYVTIEPSIRATPFSFPLYFFGGPRISFNDQHSFTYKETNNPDLHGDLSNVQTVMYAGQIGAGYDVILSKAANPMVFALSPFVSYLPDFGNAPRLIENWNVNMFRAGLSFKFAHKPKPKVVETRPVLPSPVAVVPEPQVQFAVNAPTAAPVKLEVLETFPLRNYIFINDGSTAIPGRYIKLNQNEAADFKEESMLALMEGSTERSAKQLTVYYNILNIIGDRMRNNSEAHLTLIGSSVKVNEGRAFAENVKTYLTGTFGIAESRITTQQRSKPLVPSEHLHGHKQLTLVREEDRRVDISSTSPALLTEVGSKTLKSAVNSIENDPANFIVFKVNNAEDNLKTWSVAIVDEKGFKQSFGPYIAGTTFIPAKYVLANSAEMEGNYQVSMIAQTKSGKSVKKDTTIHLFNQQLVQSPVLRYSILFDFDKSHTLSTYQDFLTNVVAPNIPENSTVIIHGHTDIVGSEKHNQVLSDNRAMIVQKTLQSALAKAGKNGVKFNTKGFGQDVTQAAFANNLPEERFYNRTVIVDIMKGN